MEKNKKRISQSGSTSSKGEKYKLYFQTLIDELREKYSFTSAKVGQPQNWYSFSSGVKGVYYGANFASGGKARAELYIDLGDFEKNKYVFEQLKKEIDIVEPLFGEPIAWERLDNKRASRLAFYRAASISDSDSELEEIRSWHINKLLKIKEILGPKISPIANYANNHM